MSSTILIVGATGNTGKNAVKTLSSLLQSKKDNRFTRILGLTRSKSSATSQELAKLPLVEMAEKDWTEIDADWIKEQGVVRAYIAPHNLPEQFVDESRFYIALLKASVEYVVKLSTHIKFIGPASSIFYGRSHWATENLLSQPEFSRLQWTSLRPNGFTNSFLYSVGEWIKEFRKTGKQTKLPVFLDADASTGLIDPNDIGDVAAYLLVLDDVTPHNHAKYVLSGPEDVNGKQVVAEVEKIVGTKVQHVDYRNTDFYNSMVENGVFPSKHKSSFIVGTIQLWTGEHSLSNVPTSKEVLELCPPKRTFDIMLKSMSEDN